MSGKKKPKMVVSAVGEKYYKQLGLQPGQPEAWEDGMRTHGGKGTYEWWYTDAEFEDGTTVVVVFFSKFGFDVSGPARPTVSIDITLPDGTEIHEMYSGEKGKVINASTEKANVQVKDSYLRDIGGAYELKYSHGTIEYQAMMKTTIPMWRPATGHSLFGDEQEYFFAWIVAQPASDVEGSLTLNGKTTALTGKGYHDHNWGNIGMQKLMNHWYWGRAKVGEYNVITADIISEKKYGYTRMPLMMVAKDGKVIAGDNGSLKVERGDTIQHPITGKFIDNRITFILTDEEHVEYRIDYLRQKDIVAASLLERLPAVKRFLARLLGAKPTYVRTLGDVVLTITDGEDVIRVEQEGLWEQMFFGSNKEAHIWR